MTTRRTFLLAAGSALAAPLLAPSVSLARSRRPSRAEPIGVGLIGAGKRGFELLGPLLDRADCRVVAVCDVDTNRREEALKRVHKKNGNTDCVRLNEYRELLAMPSVNAVVVATPDHWHANMVIHAAMAKKDIYVEKPLPLYLAEGPAMIDAVRKNSVVCQTGSQQRSEYDHKFVDACDIVRAGRLGKILTVHVGVGVSSKLCDLPTEDSEPGLDWDRWLGPAPMRGYNSILSPRGVHNHYPSWRLYSEYSGGMMTDFGAHNFDIMQWGLGMDDSGPVEIIPPSDPKADRGCRLIYANGVEIIHGGPDGITFTGESGMLHVWRGRISSVSEDILKKPLEAKEKLLPRHSSHLDNWFECIRTRQRPVADVEIGSRSNACGLLCNLAYWHRRKLKWDPKTWTFTDDAEANSWRDYNRRAGYELPKA